MAVTAQASLLHLAPCLHDNWEMKAPGAACQHMGEAQEREKQRTEVQQQRAKQEADRGGEEQEEEEKVPLMALNHVSRLCRSVEASIDFYTKVLGFVLITRPPSLHFHGAWLFNYGVGVHLVQHKGERLVVPDAAADRLDPMDNHISFQCEDMGAMERRLKRMGIRYLKRTISMADANNDQKEQDQERDHDQEEEETKKGSLPIDQLFFNDPDGFMVEICNCENLDLVPVGSLGKIRLPRDRHNPPLQFSLEGD